MPRAVLYQHLERIIMTIYCLDYKISTVGTPMMMQHEFNTFGLDPPRLSQLSESVMPALRLRLQSCVGSTLDFPFGGLLAYSAPFARRECARMTVMKAMEGNLSLRGSSVASVDLLVFPFCFTTNLLTLLIVFASP